MINVKFKNEAISNHMIYGIWRYPANLFILVNFTIIIDTDTIRSKIHIYARVNSLNEKKINGHIRFIINCVIYIFGISLISSYIIYDDTPINIYSIVQTTGNIHDGIMLSTLFCPTEINPTMIPNINGIKIEIINLL